MTGRLAAAVQALSRRTDEAGLAAYYDRLPTREAGGRLAHVLRHPVEQLLALAAVARLPVLQAELGTTTEGAAIRELLAGHVLPGCPRGRLGLAVLDVPVDPADYLVGPRKQTLRRKARAAQQQGVTCRLVTDVRERQELLARADAAEREHPDPVYRVDEPQNDDLLAAGLWLVAQSSDGTPLLLAVTPVDGAWASLRYSRTLGWSPLHSDARYLAHVHLVEALADRGARHLVDTMPPWLLPAGLRHFQRMLGFRLARVVVTRPPTSTARRRRDAAHEADTAASA